MGGGIRTRGNGRISVARRVGRAKSAGGHESRARQQCILINNMYEVQVLDSYQAKTYADGQAGAIYGQSPPLVNASKPPVNGRLTTSFLNRLVGTNRAS